MNTQEKPAFMVYYRNWRDAEMHMVNTKITDPNPTKLTDLPVGIDIVTIFGGVPEDANADEKSEVEKFYKKLKEVYAPEMHKRGVKLLSALFYDNLNESIKNFTRDDEYDSYARSLIEKYVEQYNLDGLDLDQEFSFKDEEIARLTKLIQALGRYLGPMSGTEKYLLYDTNLVASPVLNETVKPYFNFVGYQQYGKDSSATQIFTKANADISAKTLAGLTFPEEQDPTNRWYDTSLPYEQSHAKKVADYVRDNQLGGMFFYAVDRDGRTYDNDENNGDFAHIKPTAFLWTKTAIAEVKGLSLDEAKKRAQKYLDDNKSQLKLTDEQVLKLSSAITNSKSIYDVNSVFLSDDYDASISPTFDLMKVSLS